MSAIDCTNKTVREINQFIRRGISEGTDKIRITSPSAQHNIGVGLVHPVHLSIDGSVGYYCGGMIDGPMVHIHGSAGWGVGEGMMNGTVIVDGHAGNGAAASIRGGTVVIKGDAAARCGIAMKGGTVIVGGSVGYMSGFMMQKGIMVVCGDAGEGIGDSLYEGVIFVAGDIEDLGHDAVVEEPTDADKSQIDAQLTQYGIDHPGDFKKIVAGRQLWNFDKREWDVWKSAL